MSLWARKPIAELHEGADNNLQRHLGLGHLTFLGVGGTIGAGIFVLTGTAAANYAGPGVALSFVLAGIACLCAALCYAELASMIPVSGSAYVYAYATMGEFVAWVIGWNLILEYLFATSTIAVGWSGYFTAYLADLGLHLPRALTMPPIHSTGDGGWVLGEGLLNLPAMAVIALIGVVLMFGIKESARANAVMVAVKVAVVLLVVGFGAMHVDTANWTPFVPENTGEFGKYGWSGVVRAAGVVFFAYVGFDMVSSASQEAKNPRRDIPLSLLFTLAVCTTLYIAMCLVMTGLADYRTLNVPHPVFVAIDRVASLAWLKPLISVGAIVGLASAMLVTLYGQTRIFYRMGQDGLIPPFFNRVHPRFGTPVNGTIFVAAAAAIISGLLPIDLLGELVSIGTLLAFSIVCAGVIVLRVKEPGQRRVFRAPAIWLVGPAGIATCGYMMISLPGETWIRFAVWLALGVAVYFLYSRKYSRLTGSAAAVAQPAE